MKRVLKLVGRISGKGGRAKTFSLVLCSFIVLLLVASVYGVFGDGVTGGAVAGSSVSSGAAINADGSAYWEKAGVAKIEVDRFTTSSCSGELKFGITSSLATQDIDACIKTNRPISSQSDVFLWRNKAHTVDNFTRAYVDGSYEMFLENESRSVVVENGSWVVANNMEEVWYEDWDSVKSLFKHYSYNNQEYYCIEGVNFQKDKGYKMLWQFGFPIEELETGGWGCNEKFGFLVKRSSDSISNALSNDDYVELDPTFYADYINRVNISFTTPSSIVSDSIVTFTVGTADWSTQDNFQDVRIYDNTLQRELRFVNLTSKTNNTGFLVEVKKDYTAGQTYSNEWFFYFNAPSNSTPPEAWDYHFIYFPTEGSGTPSLYTKYGRHVCEYVGNSGDYISWIPGSYGNYTLNWSATGSNYGSGHVVNCSSAMDGWMNASSGSYTLQLVQNYTRLPDAYYSGHYNFGISGDKVYTLPHITWNQIEFETVSSTDNSLVRMTQSPVNDGSVPNDANMMVSFGSTPKGYASHHSGERVDETDVNNAGWGGFNWEHGEFYLGATDIPYDISNRVGYTGDIDLLIGRETYITNKVYYNPPRFTFGDIESANTAPTIPGGVTISPFPEANDDFDLGCTFKPLDSEDLSLTAYVDWYKDGVLNITGLSMSVYNDTEATFVLKSENTTIGDVWFCNVSVSDGVYSSDWVNSSETEIVSVSNWTNFQTPTIQSNNVKDVFVYDTSKESWNRTDETTSWYAYVTSENFPDKVYLVLNDLGLDIIDASDDTRWMYFTSGANNAIESTKDFTSVYALDGKIYVGSDKGLYVLDFANDNMSRYDNTNGLAYYNDPYPFKERNTGKNYIVHDATKKLASDVVNDVHASRVRGSRLVGVATDGSATGAVNIINMDDGSIAELDFCEDPNDYDSESVFIADDGTLYFSENHITKQLGRTKLSYKYNIDTYSGTDGRAEGYDPSAAAKARCEKVGYRSKDFPVRLASYPHFLSEKINNVYVTSGTSRRHVGHNTIYAATEQGITVIQEVQDNEGRGISKVYGYVGSANSNIDYKVLEGQIDNVTAVTARSDGNAMYVGTNNGSGVGSVSKISLNSNTLVDSWNTTTDPAIVGNDTTSLDFLDGDLLIGTLDSGATQIVESELDHYLITEHDKHRIIEIDSTGLIHFEFGVYNTAGSDSTHLNNPTDAVRLTNGNTLIADYGNTRILEIDPDGTVVQEIGNSTQLSDATYLDGVYSVKKV